MSEFNTRALSTQAVDAWDKSRGYNNYNFRAHKWQSEIDAADSALFKTSDKKEESKLNSVDILKERDNHNAESKANSSNKASEGKVIQSVHYGSSEYLDYNFRTKKSENNVSNADKGMGFLDSMPKEKQAAAEEMFYAIVLDEQQAMKKAEKVLTDEEKCKVHQGAIQFLFEHRK